jgi:hypothetical protein
MTGMIICGLIRHKNGRQGKINRQFDRIDAQDMDRAGYRV